MLLIALAKKTAKYLLNFRLVSWQFSSSKLKNNIKLYFLWFSYFFTCPFRCVAIKEYMSTDFDKYHCPRCEPISGPSISKLNNQLGKF